MKLSVTVTTARSLSGDGVKIASDNATLVKWAPVVTEIGVSFPDK
ncbi:hypothetical protein [Bradyrhizobium sp. CB1015]|nr:hypothetical protein [Bradyrhizobium sp. CB1015]UWU96198.1 hypothetical protein N2604_24900 [Bradyrhizobium sp. CB1015]